MLKISKYTFEEFREIAVSRLTKEKVDKFIASVIAEKVWKELGSRDIRDVLKLGRLASSNKEVSFIVKLMRKKVDP